MMFNISPKFKPNTYDSEFAEKLLKYEATPEAMIYFMENCDGLTNYSYWFFLSTLWVSYSGWVDLHHWKKAFSSKRGDRRLSIMKPNELQEFNSLPSQLTVYRAHRPDEVDFISFTIDPGVAANMALSRNVDAYTEYKINKKYCVALFLRRGEKEIISLESHKARKVQEIQVNLVKYLPMSGGF